MFELSIILLALFIAGLFSFIHAVYIALPPKAKLLCDAWEWAESKEQLDNNKP